MTDLTAQFLGMRLRSPIVASSSPLTAHPATLRRLDRAGVGAVVLPSLFEEQLSGGPMTGDLGTALARYNGGATRYLSLVEDAARSIRAPVIASVNVVAPGEWVRYLPRLADAGADAVEVSVFSAIPDPALTAEALARRFERIVRDSCSAVDLPVAVKLPPQLSAISHLAGRLADAGAAGIVLFNRVYHPDVIVDLEASAPLLPLSSPDEAALAIRWVAVLRGRVGCSLAAGGGLHSTRDVLDALRAGADVAMMTSALLRFGPEHVATVRAGLARWLQGRGEDSLSAVRGERSCAHVADLERVFRQSYLRALAFTAAPEYWRHRVDLGAAVDFAVQDREVPTP